MSPHILNKLRKTTQTMNDAKKHLRAEQPGFRVAKLSLVSTGEKKTKVRWPLKSGPLPVVSLISMSVF